MGKPLPDIPKLPDDLYELIRTAPTPKNERQPTIESEKSNESEKKEEDCKTDLKDLKALCCCLSIAQLDDYAAWIRLGLILKKIGAPLSLWEEVSKRSRKFKNADCTSKWSNLNPKCIGIGSLIVLAKQGNLEMYERIRPSLNMNQDVFKDDVDYKPTLINTPYLTTKPGQEPNKDQKECKKLADRFMEQVDQKSLIIRSRYGSVKPLFSRS